MEIDEEEVMHVAESSPATDHPMLVTREDKLKLVRHRTDEADTVALFSDPNDPFYAPHLLPSILEGHEALKKQEAELWEERKLQRPDPIQELVDKMCTLGQDAQERVVFEVALRPQKAAALMEEQKRSNQLSALLKYPYMAYQKAISCLLARDSEKMFESESELPCTAMDWIQQQAECAVITIESCRPELLADAAEERHLQQLARGVPPWGLKVVEDERFRPTENLMPDIRFESLVDIYVPDRDTAWLCQRANVERFRRQSPLKDKVSSVSTTSSHSFGL